MLKIFCAMFVCSLFFITTGYGHAFPETQSPGADETVTAGLRTVSIRFDSKIEPPPLSKLIVINNNQKATKLQVNINQDSDKLETNKIPLSPGEYTVKWSVVATDGHRTEGTYQFSVK